VTAQEKPKVIPVDNFVRDEQDPADTQAFGTQPFVTGPVQYALRSVFMAPGA
jgi:hypothetical protein